MFVCVRACVCVCGGGGNCVAGNAFWAPSFSSLCAFVAYLNGDAGEGAFKPELFGARVTVERVISKSRYGGLVVVVRCCSLSFGSCNDGLGCGSLALQGVHVLPEECKGGCGVQKERRPG